MNMHTGLPMKDYPDKVQGFVSFCDKCAELQSEKPLTGNWHVGRLVTCFKCGKLGHLIRVET